ncbi:hypothetical protein V5O48_016350 [Marasmius crinis-equi]|uniref:GST N-terminal domain-containing protein n=1 Tax=Marasmius crinis-equi TaxID=585013 RepID=A0ABR3ES26_9AGAR
MWARAGYPEFRDTQLIVARSCQFCLPKNALVYRITERFTYRYTLNYKSIPYKVQLVDYVTLEPIAKSLGALPTAKKPDGSPRWTVPFIYDSSSNRTVSDSLAIAEYLEKMYPKSPQIFPSGTKGLQAAFCDAVIGKIVASGFATLLRPKLRELGTEEVKESMRIRYGTGDSAQLPPLAESNAEVVWSKSKEAFDELAQGYPEVGDGVRGVFVMGDEPLFADFALGGLLWEFMVAFGKDSEEWKRMGAWMGGRAGRLVQVLDAVKSARVIEE